MTASAARTAPARRGERLLVIAVLAGAVGLTASWIAVLVWAAVAILGSF